jgi:hypothetical protein
MPFTIAFAIGLLGQFTPGTPEGSDTSFSDSVFKIPVYPGSRLEPHSSQRIGIDSPRNWYQRVDCSYNLIGGWGRCYRSGDPLLKVQAYYIKEAKKLGRLIPWSDKSNPPWFFVPIMLPNHECMMITGARESDESTRIEVYRFLLAASDPRYNLSVPKK